MPLLDAETFYRPLTLAPPIVNRVLAAPPAEWAVRLYWTAHLRPAEFGALPSGPPPSFDAHRQALRGGMAVALDVLPAITLVNDCRWVVYCPDQTCLSAQVAARSDRRFFCVGCLNREAGGHWRQAWWPEAAEETAVEQVHTERAATGHLRGDPPEIRLCHWWPSDGAGKPHPLLAQLRQEGRLRQLYDMSVALGAGS